jgi:hypothetical protein
MFLQISRAQRFTEKLAYLLRENQISISLEQKKEQGQYVVIASTQNFGMNFTYMKEGYRFPAKKKKERGI